MLCNVKKINEAGKITSTSHKKEMLLHSVLGMYGSHKMCEIVNFYFEAFFTEMKRLLFSGLVSKNQ